MKNIDQYLALFLKRYQIRPQLQWKKNRNSYANAIYRMFNGAIFNDHQ